MPRFWGARRTAHREFGPYSNTIRPVQTRPAGVNAIAAMALDAACGGTGHPLVICLHGFPEYWAAWSAVMLELADAYHLVAPDQRGFNLSFRPRDVGAY